MNGPTMESVVLENQYLFPEEIILEKKIYL